MQSLLVNQSPVAELTYSNKMRVIYDGVEQDAELRKYPSGKVYFRTENAHFVPVGEVGMLIPLTKGMNAIVDFEDYERIVGMGKWHYNNGYATRTSNLKIESKKWQASKILMHRFVMNPPNGMSIDHKDGNTLNNQKSNLRICTHGENMKNRKMQKGNTSGYKGVYWSKAHKKWHAYIKVNKKPVFLGLHTCLYDAARAYNKAAIEHHGVFAKLNEIQDGN